MANRIFSSIKANKPRRNVFDLSRENKLTCNMGDLIPIFCQEVVPGDTFKVNTGIMMRLAPMLAPIMHRVNVYTHFFFVPNRLVWNEWQDFITGGENGTTQPPFPRIVLSGAQVLEYLKTGSLPDYFGLPTFDGTIAPLNGIDVSALPFRAYQMIYNEYYRDQNVGPIADFTITSGTVDSADVDVLFKLRKRAWEKDYFTSALPWAQRGAPVTLPLGGAAPVRLVTDSQHTDPFLVRGVDGSPIGETNLYLKNTNRAGGSTLTVSDNASINQQVVLDPNGRLQADLSTATATTINDLRRSVKLQEWLERNARGGARYIEQILSHFGVSSSDARLQRPEYLGGGKSPIAISEVLQTSSTDSISPQANPAGYGMSSQQTHEFKRFFEEHGYIIGIMSVLPRTAYQQGVPKHFRKFDKFDYYFPSFAHLGEQAIGNWELYYDWNDASGYLPGTFGYTPRYAEYKSAQGTVHGDFRNSLSFWHLGRIFDTPPNLNEQFIQANPSQRIFAVDDPKVHKLWVQIYHSVRAIRPMPKFGTPYF